MLSVASGAKLDVTVTRKQFEAACEDLFTLCIDTAKAVLECARSGSVRVDAMQRTQDA